MENTMAKIDKKEFVDPATASFVGGFVVRSIAQAIIGWLGLEYFKKIISWFKNEHPTEKISGEKQTKNN